MCRMDFRRFCEEWRIWIRPLLIVTYIIFAIIVVPLLIVNTVKEGFAGRNQLILIGGLFVLSAVPVSIWHIIQHVIHFTQPILQKHIIRILWMVPIYALNAWIGLCFPKHSIYVDSLRECYEAYVIYNFMIYLLNYLNLGMDLEATMQYKPQVYHFFPLCCMRPWIMGREFIHNCKHGILQYTVVRPITTFISVICELCGVYGEGMFAGNVAFPYIVVINNISQFVAMYCLVLFYRANKDDLKPMKPIPKFLCIKAVVFFSFFQGVLLNALVYYNVFKTIFKSDDADGQLAATLQNFLICIEMFIAAVAHMYSFPHHPFHINSPQYWNNPNRNWCRAFLSMMDISDMQEDVTEHLGVVSSSISRRFQGRAAYQPLSRGPRRSSSESEYLMSKRQDGNGQQQLTTPTPSEIATGNNRHRIEYNTFRKYAPNIVTAAATVMTTTAPTATATNTINTNTNRTYYGATDRLVVPVYCDDVVDSHLTSQSQLAGMSRHHHSNNTNNITTTTTAATTNSGSNNPQRPTTSSISAYSNFGGIGIQSRRPRGVGGGGGAGAGAGGGNVVGVGGDIDYGVDFLGGAAPPITSGSSFLLARNVSHSPIPESSNDDYVSLLGSSDR